MKIGIFGKSIPSESLATIQLLLQKLESFGYQATVYQPFSEKLKSKFGLHLPMATFLSHEELSGQLDYLISVGGDGTLLDTITLVRDSGIPIMGVNIGRMGFLSSVAKEELEQALDSLRDKRFVLDRRSLVRLESPQSLFGELNYALNEVTVYKKEPDSMLTISTYINDVFLNSYWADGLIIATPTGSTAYSLSCGGPIVVPGSENFIITPIATHNLTVRPIVIPDKSRIRLKVEGRDKSFFISLDSRFKELESLVDIVIAKEQFKINLIRMEKQNFFRTIRDKLNWGLDIRNYPNENTQG